MCLAIPGKVIKIEDSWADVEIDGHIHRASLSLLKDVKIGDFLLVHADLALNKVAKEEAERILEMVKNSEKK